MSHELEEQVWPEYAQVAANKVGTYEVFTGNGSAGWQDGGPRLTGYPPDGDTFMGSLSPEAIEAVQKAGYTQRQEPSAAPSYETPVPVTQ